jgi:hypothetical protein
VRSFVKFEMPANFAGERMSHWQNESMKEAKTGMRVNVKNPVMFGARKAAPERILEMVLFLLPRRTALEWFVEAMGLCSVS